MDTLRASFTILTTTAACIAKMRIGNNYLAMEEFYGSFQVCNGHKHVLCSRNIFLLRSIYPYVLFCLSWSTWFLYFPILKKTSLQDLDHMLSFIQSLQSFPLSQLEQWDLEIFGDNSVVCDDFEIYLWWDQPAKEVSEDNVVSKWNDVLDLPEDWSWVPEIIIKVQWSWI